VARTSRRDYHDAHIIREVRVKPIFPLLAVGLALAAAPVTVAQPTPSIDPIVAIADASQCKAVNWADRGRAPRAYIRGMALVYARALCEPDRADVRLVSAARAAPGVETNKTDGLTWYEPVFTARAMPNTQAGRDTLRHAYVLMIGLGMRESSGQHCVGRDRSADFTAADSAEAGLFQTSSGARRFDPTLPQMTAAYAADPRRCMATVFSQGVSCPAHDAETFGAGPGADWQKLTKACPAFATEYAAVVLRKHGGSKGEYGPIRNRKAEVRAECDTMLRQVEALVASQPGICAAVR
jgi:hypothetical protein